MSLASCSNVGQSPSGLLLNLRHAREVRQQGEQVLNDIDLG